MPSTNIFFQACSNPDPLPRYTPNAETISIRSYAPSYISEVYPLTRTSSITNYANLPAQGTVISLQSPFSSADSLPLPCLRTYLSPRFPSPPCPRISPPRQRLKHAQPFLQHSRMVTCNQWPPSPALSSCCQSPCHYGQRTY